MANTFTVSLDGIDNLMSVLKNTPKKKLDEIHDEIEAAAFEMVDIAKRLVPKDMAGSAGLAGAISARQTSYLNYEFVAQRFYAAFVEFGTGANAAAYVGSIDKEFAAYAQTFYISGKGKMKPHPYAYPALMQVRGQLIENIKNILIR